MKFLYSFKYYFYYDFKRYKALKKIYVNVYKYYTYFFKYYKLKHNFFFKFFYNFLLQKTNENEKNKKIVNFFIFNNLIPKRFLIIFHIIKNKYFLLLNNLEKILKKKLNNILNNIIFNLSNVDKKINKKQKKKLIYKKLFNRFLFDQKNKYYRISYFFIKNKKIYTYYKKFRKYYRYKYYTKIRKKKNLYLKYFFKLLKINILNYKKKNRKKLLISNHIYQFKTFKLKIKKFSFEKVINYIKIIIKKSINNFFVTAINQRTGNVIIKGSCGSLGDKGARKYDTSILKKVCFNISYKISKLFKLKKS